MSNNTVRIRTTPNGNDKYLKVKLEQEFDFIEILSLKISQEDAYRNFCSDYGVVAGRVIINSGFGVANAKVSIFIPIDDEDSADPTIKGLYPYEIVSDKDSDGIRYNVLPRTSETDNECFTPIGTFPTKREVLDNPEMLNVYCKYYKFTTTTNNAGDFMIFGVPVGTYTVHVDVDISDIGIASQRPYDSISQGTPQKFFDSPTKFKGGTNLDKLIQVKSSNIGVNVQPFWGDLDSCEIGISRVDIDLNYNIQPAAIFIGSIYGDQEKNSVNKRCRPRMAMGELCEQITGEGSIEMIRETVDGTIEKFDIEGGRLIDTNGNWSFQIPMNLDYRVTDEFGTLIPSEDPNKGVPTRANVRFKIGLDETGGLGRLRTRAKYLVPNNPANINEIDYEFGEKTKKSSLRELHWNKIYSVSNFISRFQRRGGAVNRNMVGVKDVDKCVGDKNPFPYNKVNTITNPLFIIICLIMTIIEIIIYFLNHWVFYLINEIVGVIKSILKFLCEASYVLKKFGRPLRFLGFACGLNNRINFIECINVPCGDDDPKYFAPGCRGDALTYTNPTPYSTERGPLLKCVAFQLAKALHMFQFDFYNDWANGSLYAYLLKYKKRKSREKYCEYDCSDYGGQNDCRSSLLMDTCYNGGKYSQKKTFSASINEGLIKKYNGELLYAATTHNANLKLYATEIINLGSVFNCDWQGVPKIQEILTPTTYIMPPDTDEIDDNNAIDVSGQVSLGNGSFGLFFDIDCLGLSTNYRQCLNIRHICEFGVNLDEQTTGANNTVLQPNNNIGSTEIDDGNGRWVRDVFFGLNNTTNFMETNYPYTTDFNLANCSEYNFSSINPSQCDPNIPTNGEDYVKFRGYTNDDNYQQPKHSFYFYFGLLPGKTALDKMNSMFFTKCYPKLTTEFLIKVSDLVRTSSDTSSDGSFTFTIISGVAPFTYTVSGPNGYINTGTLSASPTLTLNGLASGDYTITILDDNGNQISQNTTVNGPLALFADASATKDSSIANVNDGEITITNVGGGSGTYTYTLFDNYGTSVSSGNITTLPLIIPNLAAMNASNGLIPEHFGYYLVVTDSDGDSVTVYDLVVNGPTSIIINVNKTDVLCFGDDSGQIELSISGGNPPYSTETLGPNSYTSNSYIMSNLTGGTFTTTVTDDYGTQASVVTQITIANPEIAIEVVPPSELNKQCDPTQHEIKFYVTAGGNAFGGQVYTQYSLDGAEDANGEALFVNGPTLNFVNDTTPLSLFIPAGSFTTSIAVRITNQQGTCFSGDEDISISEVALPIVALNANVTNLDGTTIDNTKQCTPNFVTFKVNISHLQYGMTNRGPYEVKFKVNNGAVQTRTVTTNQQVITSALPSASTTCVVQIVSVTDSLGCVSPSFTLPTIQLPSQALGGSWTVVPIPGSTTTVKKYLPIVGGVQPYSTVSGYAYYDNTPSTMYTVATNNTLSSTIQDSVGCSITVNG
jgi:hypothetical protein